MSNIIVLIYLPIIMLLLLLIYIYIYHIIKIYIIRPKPGPFAKNATPSPSGWESNPRPPQLYRDQWTRQTPLTIGWRKTVADCEKN